MVSAGILMTVVMVMVVVVVVVMLVMKALRGPAWTTTHTPCCPYRICAWRRRHLSGRQSSRGTGEVPSGCTNDCGSRGFLPWQSRFPRWARKYLDCWILGPFLAGLQRLFWRRLGSTLQHESGRQYDFERRFYRRL